MTKRYYSVEGEILGDSDAGDYMRDALGSVTATCNPDTGSVWNTYRYKPYGSDLSSSGGEKPDPKFRWVGTAGYRQTSISHSSSYIRARHYGREVGRWTTIDRLVTLVPTIHSYSYVSNRPTGPTDRTGLYLDFDSNCKGINISLPNDPCEQLRKCRSDQKCMSKVMSCLKKHGFGDTGQVVKAILEHMNKVCGPKTDPKSMRVCIHCWNGPPPNWPPACKNINPCANAYGSTYPFDPFPGVDGKYFPPAFNCTWWSYKDDYISPCTNAIRNRPGGKKCDCIIFICDNQNPTRDTILETIIHEMIHCTGAIHATLVPTTPDYVDILGCCLCRALSPDIVIPDPCRSDHCK